jgi:hypothetical protein
MTHTPAAPVQCFFEDVELDVLLETPGITITQAHVALLFYPPFLVPERHTGKAQPMEQCLA